MSIPKSQIFPNSINKVWPSSTHVQLIMPRSESNPSMGRAAWGLVEPPLHSPGGSMRAWAGEALWSWAACTHPLHGGRQRHSKGGTERGQGCWKSTNSPSILTIPFLEQSQYLVFSNHSFPNNNPQKDSAYKIKKKKKTTEHLCR